MKYYVDSGDLKVVLEASDPLDACAKAIFQNIDRSEDLDDVLSFEKKFIVSQKGFVTRRESFVIEVPFESIIDADDVLAYYGENY
tara:strand:+ start:234 stop:488 length:255 start_codon:yes stop_codon:yes gene_type:complete